MRDSVNLAPELSNNPILRAPTAEDGMSVFRLVEACSPLDPNSSYCNLLQCTHFAVTSVAAELDGELVGFVSGYLIPDRPNTLFVWQVAVSEKARGQGLATKMIEAILQRRTCRGVQFIETTITEDNAGSWALFERLSSKLDGKLERSNGFDKDRHFDGQHDSEKLVRIGPFVLPIG